MQLLICHCRPHLNCIVCILSSFQRFLIVLSCLYLQSAAFDLWLSKPETTCCQVVRHWQKSHVKFLRLGIRLAQLVDLGVFRCQKESLSPMGCYVYRNTDISAKLHPKTRAFCNSSRFQIIGYSRWCTCLGSWEISDSAETNSLSWLNILSAAVKAVFTRLKDMQCPLATTALARLVTVCCR